MPTSLRRGIRGRRGISGTRATKTPSPWVIPSIFDQVQQEAVQPLVVATYDENTDSIIPHNEIEATEESAPTPAEPEAKKVPMLSADVEFFLRSDLDGSFVPATGLTGGGAKGAPIWLDKYTGILEDNAAVELNMPPSRDDMVFGRTVMKARQGLQQWARSKGLSVRLANTQRVSAELMAKNHMLSQFGCAEDYIAYGTHPEYPRKPVNAKVLGDIRCAAGHLHLSYDTTDLPPYIVARWLDATIGLDSVFWDIQKARRPFYGLAGLYRPTKYPDGSTGVEYRSLSNLWFFDSGMTERISCAVFYVINRLREDLDAAKAQYAKIPWSDVRAAIDSENEKEALSVQTFVSQTSAIVSGCRSNILGSSKNRKLAFTVEE